MCSVVFQVVNQSLLICLFSAFLEFNSSDECMKTYLLHHKKEILISDNKLNVYREVTVEYPTLQTLITYTKSYWPHKKIFFQSFASICDEISDVGRVLLKVLKDYRNQYCVKKSNKIFTSDILALKSEWNELCGYLPGLNVSTDTT